MYDLNLINKRLKSAIQNSGKFIYGYAEIDKNGRTGDLLDGYNYLRHAGALWVLTNNYRRRAKDTYIHQSAKYLISKTIKEKERSAIISGTAWKSGLIGITILPLINMGANRLAQKLAVGAIKHQRENGTFIDKINKDGSESSFVSEYYTGELLYGLMQVNTAFSREMVLPLYVPHFSTTQFVNDQYSMVDKAAKKLLSWCLDNNYGVEIQSHWMMYALYESLNHTPYRVNDILELASNIVKSTINNSAYRDYGRSTPISCRLELFGVYNLIASVALAKYGKKIKISDKLKKHVKQDLQMLEKYYVNGYFIKDKESREWRIDYNQHAHSGIKLTSSLTS